MIEEAKLFGTNFEAKEGGLEAKERSEASSANDGPASQQPLSNIRLLFS